MDWLVLRLRIGGGGGGFNEIDTWYTTELPSDCFLPYTFSGSSASRIGAELQGRKLSDRVF